MTTMGTAGAACPACRQRMQPLVLTAHYGRRVEVDLCAGCHMLWFDGHESVNLAGRGVLDLLRAIDASHGRAHQPLASQMTCPRCEARLQRSANLTALGPTAHHECPRGHGAAQSFSLYLAEKGFLRPLYRPEVEQLRTRPAQRQQFACLNCGGRLDPRDRESCSFCASPVQVIDVLPLMRAVDRQTGQLAPGAATTAGLAWRHATCAHCGAPTDPARERRCEACAMPITLTDLKQALAWIEPLVPAIEAGQATAEHRRRRLAESLDTAPVVSIAARPVQGYRLPAWLYLVGAGLMLGLPAVAVLLVRYYR